MQCIDFYAYKKSCFVIAKLVSKVLSCDPLRLYLLTTKAPEGSTKQANI
jgi:hypothetical protein